MGKSIFIIFQVFGIVSAWAEKALADGKITILEAVELATMLATLLGISIDIDTSALFPDDTSKTDNEGWKRPPDSIPMSMRKPASSYEVGGKSNLTGELGAFKRTPDAKA